MFALTIFTVVLHDHSPLKNPLFIDSNLNIFYHLSGMPADLMAINDVDWVPTLKMGAEESHQPVAKPVLDIPYREHKDHDYCAAPGTPL